jgi:hypothetical protein
MFHSVLEWLGIETDDELVDYGVLNQHATGSSLFSKKIIIFLRLMMLIIFL